MEEEVFRDQRNGNWGYMQPAYIGVYVFTLFAAGISISQVPTSFSMSYLAILPAPIGVEGIGRLGAWVGPSLPSV